MGLKFLALYIDSLGPQGFRWCEPGCSQRRVQTECHPGAGVDQGQLDVLDRGQARQQVEALENASDVPVAQGGDLADAEVAHRPTGEPVVPGVRAVEAAESISSTTMRTTAVIPGKSARFGLSASTRTV